MILNEKKVEVIKLAIARIHQLVDRGEDYKYIYLCHAFDYLIYFGSVRDNIVHDAEELKEYILKGIGGLYVFTGWLGRNCPLFGDIEEIPDEVKLMARICWLERLIYFAEEGWSSVEDDGKKLTYIPF